MTAAEIDMCKASLDLAVDGRRAWLGLPQSRRFRQAGQAPAGTWDHADRGEATGGYEEPLLDACCDAGLWIARVKPRQARAFANATGELAKTDAHRRPDPSAHGPAVRRPSAALRRTAALAARAARLAAPPVAKWVVLLQAQKQRAAMAPAPVHKLAARTIAALVRELAAIEKMMKALIPDHAKPALSSSMGRGPVFQANVMTLLSELGCRVYWSGCSRAWRVW